MKTIIIILSAIGIALAAMKHSAGAHLLTNGPAHNTRTQIIDIATAELGVREATGNNDGKRVEEYLRYTGLGKGHAWCAAFVSWCYGQAGLTQPRNPWSPALFPNARTYWKTGRVRADQQSLNRIQPLDFSFDSSFDFAQDDMAQDDGQEGGQVQVKKEKNGGAVLSARPKTSNSSATAKLGSKYAENQIGPQRLWMLISKSIQKIYRPCLFQRAWDGARGRLGIGQRPWSLGLFQGLGPSGQEDGKAVRRKKPSQHQTQINPADIFGIYSRTARRINHIGLVKEAQGKYLITIEGNSNNRVESRRRHLSTVYALADWVSE